MKKPNPMRPIQGGKPGRQPRRTSGRTKRATPARGAKTVLPVVENERIRGVITDRDIVVRAVAREVARPVAGLGARRRLDAGRLDSPLHRTGAIYERAPR